MKPFILILLFAQVVYSQHYQLLNQEKELVSFRGLSFINDSSFVVSGSDNTIGITNDFGKTFRWIQSSQYPDRDFRDIEVISENHFIAMAIARPAVLLETKDAGTTWNEIYFNDTEGIFLDAIYKTESGEIYAVGDPVVTRKPYIVHQGKELHSLFGHALLLKEPEEAFFAASGSNLYIDDHQTLLVSGGSASHFYHYHADSLSVYSLPKINSKTSGINGLKYDPILNIGYLTGGDFTNPADPTGNFYRFSIQNNRVMFHPTLNQPSGYKTDAAIINNQTVIVCGYSGVEISKDGGNSWRVITKDSYNTCAVSPNKQWVVLVGAKGKIACVKL